MNLRKNIFVSVSVSLFLICFPILGMREKSSSEKLIDFCEKGYLGEIKRCIEKENADVNFMDRQKRTPLSACLDYEEGISYIEADHEEFFGIDYPFSCHAINGDEMLRVSMEAKPKILKMVKYLVQKGANLNPKGIDLIDKATRAYWADEGCSEVGEYDIVRYHPELVEFLVLNGAKVTKFDKNLPKKISDLLDSASNFKNKPFKSILFSYNFFENKVLAKKALSDSTIKDAKGRSAVDVLASCHSILCKHPEYASFLCPEKGTKDKL